MCRLHGQHVPWQGGPAAAVPAAGLGAKACSRTAGKTQNNVYQESALGELISSCTVPKTLQGRKLCYYQAAPHPSPAKLHGGCAIVVTAATSGDQTSKPLLSGCKGTDSLFMKQHHQHGDVQCSAPSPAWQGQLWDLAGEAWKGNTCNHPSAPSKGNMRCVQYTGKGEKCQSSSSHL